jgi:hypothetical protein
MCSALPILAEARRGGRVPVAGAKLDGLSRDVHVISGPMAHRVPFLVAELGPRRRAVAAAPGRHPRGDGARTDLPAHEGRPGPPPMPEVRLSAILA